MMGIVRSLPIVATIVVLLAVGVMVRLGVWQLDRLHEKDALVERYRKAASIDAVVAWPSDVETAESNLYRRSRLECRSVLSTTSMAGKNRDGASGVAQVARCATAGGVELNVVLGWSLDPSPVTWAGGEVQGIIAPGGSAGPRLIADPPLAGLEANALPDPSDIPNNHLSYAMQWFFFAATALVIYALAVRKRVAEARGAG